MWQVGTEEMAHWLSICSSSAGLEFKSHIKYVIVVKWWITSYDHFFHKKDLKNNQNLELPNKRIYKMEHPSL